MGDSRYCLQEGVIEVMQIRSNMSTAASVQGEKGSKSRGVSVSYTSCCAGEIRKSFTVHAEQGGV